MWGTDATRFYTEEDGWCWFFGAIDHCVDELVGWHTAKIGDRWAALEPLRQGVRHVFGGSRRTSRGACGSAVTGGHSTSPMRGSTR
jgi:putative transposase